MDVLHTAVWVSDLETEREFYTQVLGLEHSKDFVGDDGVRNYFVAGESDTEIQFKYDEDADRAVDPAGVDHLAVAVDDVDAVVEEAVEEWGSDLTGGPTAMEDLGVRVAFVTDPEGYGVEVIEDL